MSVITHPSHRRVNPILWQEITHQKRSAPRATRIGGVAVTLAVLAALIGVPLTLFSFEAAVQHTRDIALVTAWAFQAIVAARALIAGANTISREHSHQTWDALVLSGVSARQILFGKWRAAMRRAGPWMVLLGVVRMMTMPVLMLSLTARLAYYWYQYYGTSQAQYSSGIYYDSPDQPVFQWVPWAVLLAPVVAVGLSVLEVALCTAIGVMCSAVFRRGAFSVAMAFVIRFVPVIVLVMMTWQALGVNTPRWYRYPAFSLADSGTSPLYQFMVPDMPWTRNRHIDALASVGVVSAVLALFTGLSLLAGLAALRHGGAMPHRRKQGRFIQIAQKSPIRPFRTAREF